MQEQYVIFELGEQKYGIPIEYVSEITELVPITKVPNSEDYIEGVINLRGVVIPIINFKTLLNMKSDENFGKQILVVDYEGSLIGFIIDSANDVRTVDSREKEELEGSMEASNEDFSGVLNTNEEIILVVAVEKIMKDKVLDKEKYKKMFAEN